MVLSLAATLVAVCPAYAACDDLLAASADGPTSARGVTAEDLLGLRRIGPGDALDTSSQPLAVSPDGKRLAFVIARNDPQEGYCQALVAIDVTGDGAPTVLDTGGKRIIEHIGLRGAEVSAGSPAVITPRWAPDGRSIAYLKQAGSTVQLWVVPVNGGHAHAVSPAMIDVDTWIWSADGRSLIYTAEPGRLAEAESLAAEARRGYLYDARFWPGMATRPMPASDMPEKTFVTDRSGAARDADSAEAAALSAALTGGVRDAVDTRGWRASAQPINASPLSPNHIIVQAPDGADIACPASSCRDGIVGLWWDGETLLFQRREGWDHEAMAFYRWAPGTARPRRVMRTDDVLLGCVLAGRLICTDEASARPRRIVSIDAHTGVITQLFDPNPDFHRIRLGSVERLRTTNAEGLKAWADLVLPPGYKPGTKLPTIVVQYHSRGFLIGGTGNDYPIFLFAQAGYAVISFEEPAYAGYAPATLTTWDQINTLAATGWREQRSVWSSLDRALEMAVARGVIDPTRVGITGLSAGAATVQFALINSKRFAAAAISTCCIEPVTVMTQGIAWADWNRKVMGYPPLIHPDPMRWMPMSLTENAQHIRTPLLMQLADSEYLQSLEAFSALREAGAPAEMYVFPSEYHTKIDPGHRLAVWMRSLDWFDFWLRDKVDPDRAKARQYDRWQAMRQKAPPAKAARFAPRPRHREAS